MRRLVLLAALALAVPAQAATLYDDLGGEPVMRRVVEEATKNFLADKRIAVTFGETAIPRFKQLLFEQLCNVSGGPCTYTGRDMAKSHTALKITDAHFSALVEDLQDAMDKEKIAFTTQNRLLAILAPMRRDIVTR
ncbi:group I truncated hemoglobin [Roseiterribacter gracilis]|uniref:Cyanoglobin n=1 Tax=Roseiterribacter gracilis TaxID=2812848 RepID=A0A8S8XDP7_9PROT|nr:cyanoglobin [Rhodospirillales bacterium TMPK1]